MAIGSTAGPSAPFSDQTANQLFAGPAVPGASAAVPGFRSQVFADMPNQGDNAFYVLQQLGSAIKGYTIGNAFPNNSGAYTMVSAQPHFSAVILPVAATLTGIKVHILQSGSYTSTGYNGVALYTIDPTTGILTQVAASTSSTTVWQGGVSGMLAIPFSATYAAAAGVYFCVNMYQASATTTTTILGMSSLQQNEMGFDLPHSMFLAGLINTTTLAASYASSAITKTSACVLHYLY